MLRPWFIFTVTLVFVSRRWLVSAKTSCLRPSPHGSRPSHCNENITCDPNTFVVIDEITYEECKGNRQNCCCDDDENGDCKVDYEDYRDSYFVRLAKNCIGKHKCYIEAPGITESPICAFSLDYTCISEPVGLCSSTTVQKAAGTVYLSYDRTIERSKSSNCNCIATATTDRMALSWVFGSYEKTCVSTQLSIGNGKDTTSTWRCRNDVNDMVNIDGLHFLKIWGRRLNITVNNLYVAGETDAPERIWVALDVPSGSRVDIVCNGGIGDNPGTDKRIAPENSDDDGGDNTTLIVAATVVPALVIIVLLLLICVLWRKLSSKRKQSEQNTQYQHYDQREADTGYADISRQNSTYATINDLHIDTGEYSRISVKSNDYNKAYHRENEVILDPKYSRLQSRNSYSRINETPDKRCIDSSDYNHTLSTDSADDYNRTTDKAGSGKASSTDYHHIKVNTEQTDGKMKPTSDIEHVDIDGDYSKAGHKHKIAMMESFNKGGKTDKCKRNVDEHVLGGGQETEGPASGDSQNTNNVTIISVNKENPNTSRMQFKEIHDSDSSDYEQAVLSKNKSESPANENQAKASGYETAILSQNEVELPATAVGDRTTDGYETAVVKNTIVGPTKANDDTSADSNETAVISNTTVELPAKINKPVDGYETAIVTNTSVQLPTNVNKPVDGYETAVVSNTTVKLPTKIKKPVDGYETAVVSNTSVEFPAEINKPVDGYETAVVSNTSVEFPAEINKPVDGYETAVVSNTSVEFPAEINKPVDGYETAVVSNTSVEFPAEINKPVDGYETAVVSNTTVQLPTKGDKPVDGYETAVVSNNIVEFPNKANTSPSADGYETSKL